MKPLPGFSWDAKRKKAVLDGFVAGSNGRVRRQRTLKNVTRDHALAKWKTIARGDHEEDLADLARAATGFRVEAGSRGSKNDWLR